MELDKWQQRQAQQYATENGVTYEEAVAVLFGGGAPAAEAPAPEVTNPAEGDSGKVSVTK